MTFHESMRAAQDAATEEMYRRIDVLWPRIVAGTATARERIEWAELCEALVDAEFGTD